MTNDIKKRIRLLTRKHHTWESVFFKWFNKNHSLDISKLEIAFTTLLENKHLLKNEININYALYLLNQNTNKKNHNSRDIVEKFDDKIHKILFKKHKIKFIKSLKTKKYKYLFNEDTTKEINTILDNKISIKALKHQFFTKLAKFTTPEDLLKGLKDFKKKNINWNKEFYFDRIKTEKLNINIIHDKDNTLMIQVNDYKACAVLGPQAWCIVEHKINFDEYTLDLNKQILYFDFNLPLESNNSIIGFTIDLKGYIEDSYLKNDEPTPENIVQQFKFKKATDIEIQTYFTTRDNQYIFGLICEKGLVKYYDEYINKSDVDPSMNHSIAMFWAAAAGHVDIVNLLLKDPRIDPSTDHNSSLRTAAGFGHWGVVNRLLEDIRVDPSDAHNDALREAAAAGEIDIVNRLLQDIRVDPSDDHNDAILGAMEIGETEVVLRLLDDDRVDPSDNNNALIKLAAESGCTDIVKKLLADDRVNPAATKNWALKWATRKNHIAIVELLIADSRVDPSDFNNLALKIAGCENRKKVLEILLKDDRVLRLIDEKWVVESIQKKQRHGFFNLLKKNGVVLS